MQSPISVDILQIFCRYSADILMVFRCVLASLYEGLSVHMSVCPYVLPSVNIKEKSAKTASKDASYCPLGLVFFNITQLTSAAKRNRSKVDSSNRNSQAAERHPKSDYNISGENTLEAFHTRHDLKRAKC